MKFAEQMPVSMEEREGETKSLERILKSHVVDLKPKWEGSTELKKSVDGGFAGAAGTMVTRPDPPLQISKVSFIGGKSTVLVGPNGSGKSTLFDAFMGKNGADFSGGVSGYNKGVHAKESLRIARLNQEELLADIGHLSANDVLNLTTEHFKKEFPVDWEDLESYDKNLLNQEAQQRIEELVGKVGKLFEMDLFLKRKVDELSGGERTKLSLMMVLGSEPDILFLDEPTNHLDLESIAKLVGLFNAYKKAGVSIVSVSHVEWFLDMAGEDGTLEVQMNEDKRVLNASNSPHKKYVKKEKSAPIIKEPINWNREGAKKKQDSYFQTADEISIPDSPLHEIKLPTIQDNDLAVLSGKNGTGKTKLMEEMADPHGKIIKKSKGAQIAYMPQFWPEDVMVGTVEDFWEWVKEDINRHSEKQSSRFTKELRNLGFNYGSRDILREKLSSFSGGEQRLLWFVAASVVEGTDVLILDEPSNHMDSQTMMRVCEAIRNFSGGVVLSTHDLRLMQELDKNPGKSREGLGIKNIIFDRKGDASSIKESEERPAAYAERIIKEAKKAAGRIKVS